MPNSRTYAAAGLLLLAAAGGLPGNPDLVLAAERLVVGELFSADG